MTRLLFLLVTLTVLLISGTAGAQTWLRLPAGEMVVDLGPGGERSRITVKVPYRIDWRETRFGLEFQLRAGLDPLLRAMNEQLWAAQDRAKCGDDLSSSPISIGVQDGTALIGTTVNYVTWACTNIEVPKADGLKITTQTRSVRNAVFGNAEQHCVALFQGRSGTGPVLVSARKCLTRITDLNGYQPPAADQIETQFFVLVEKLKDGIESRAGVAVASEIGPFTATALTFAPTADGSAEFVLSGNARLSGAGRANLRARSQP